jgi:hypothetical protein
LQDEPLTENRERAIELWTKKTDSLKVLTRLKNHRAEVHTKLPLRSVFRNIKRSEHQTREIQDWRISPSKNTPVASPNR